MANYIGLVQVRVLQAKLDCVSIYANDVSPFVSLKLGYERSKSYTHEKGGKDPYWNYICELKHPKKYNTLRIRCYTGELFGKELLGECNILIDQLMRIREQDQWFKLSKDTKITGQIYLELSYKK